MIGLINTGWAGAMVPLDAITRVSNDWKNDHRVKMRTVELNDGRKFDLTDTQADALQGRAVQIIPALPGVSLLSADLAPTLDESCILAEPVIAWALCVDGDIRPVTPAGVLGGRSIWDDHYVQMAGGIQAVGDLTDPFCFSDRAEMLQHFFTVDYAKRKGADGFVSELDADVAPPVQA